VLEAVARGPAGPVVLIAVLGAGQPHEACLAAQLPVSGSTHPLAGRLTAPAA
jgi:hypothetical protein